MPNETFMAYYSGRGIKAVDGVLDVERRLGASGMGHLHIALHKRNDTALGVEVSNEVRLLVALFAVRKQAHLFVDLDGSYLTILLIALDVGLLLSTGFLPTLDV